MIEIELTREKVALIDDVDYDSIIEYGWRAQQNQDGRWYAIAWDNRPNFVLMHRVIMNPPDDLVVDHIDGNGLNNQRFNLQIITYGENQILRKGVKGYHWESGRSKWKAMINVNGKPIYLGRFDSEDEAALAYKNARASFYPNLIFHEEED